MHTPELSIIIPVRDQFYYFKKCIESLYKIEGADYEIVIINDGSTEPELIKYFEKFPQLTVLNNPESEGFIKACNAGAKISIGTNLLFLNSDTELIEPKSFRYMLDALAKPNIGIVGARLLLQNNSVQHAGLSFDRGQMNFVHRYYGVDRNDPRVCVSEVVEVVTGACLMIKRTLWDELGGFDKIYGLGYFEDSELCIRAKEKGYLTCYCGSAVLKHWQSKSFQGGPKKEHFEHNHEIFKERYIRTGKICQYPKILACYIAFNEEEYIAYSIKSIYDFVAKIIIVEGSTEATREYANADGGSSDGTIEAIKSVPDPKGKITVISGKWKDKTEQRNVYCKIVNESDYDYIWVIDGDEVFDNETVRKIEHLIFARPDVPAFQWNFHDFWHDFGHKSKGPWEKFIGRKSLINLTLTGPIKYDTHTLPITDDGQQIPSIFCSDIYFFHYSYVRNSEKIKQKIGYYINTPSSFYEVK